MLFCTLVTCPGSIRNSYLNSATNNQSIDTHTTTLLIIICNNYSCQHIQYNHSNEGYILDIINSYYYMHPLLRSE